MLSRLLIALVAGCVVLTGCSFNGAYDLPLPGKVVGDSDGYKVTAEFDDIVSVVPRTLVMANDVPVGQVDSIGRSKDGWHAVVVMTIKKSIILPANATAAVQQTSLLGEKYIALTAPPGSSVAKDGRLGNGAYIPLNGTTRDPEVEDVLGALSALLSGGGVAQLHTISVELNKAFDGRQADVRSALHQLDTFVNSLDTQKSDIIAAMSSINTLTSTLNRERNTIGAALDSFGPALKVLNEQHQGLVKMLTSLDRLGKVGTNVIQQSRANIVASLKHLGPTLKGLADAGNSLVPGLMLMASFPFPPAAATLAKGDYSNALFAMNFNLNTLLEGLLKGGNTSVIPNLATLCSAYAGSGNCAPLMNALCSVTRVSIFCSANTAAGILSLLTGKSGTRKTTTKTPTTSGSSGTPKSGNVLQQLLGGLL
jgi:phospholipid/cholesterol/gamma-HCH transport system substrate-binding protein